MGQTIAQIVCGWFLYNYLVAVETHLPSGRRPASPCTVYRVVVAFAARLSLGYYNLGGLHFAETSRIFRSPACAAHVHVCYCVTLSNPKYLCNWVFGTVFAHILAAIRLNRGVDVLKV